MQGEVVTFNTMKLNVDSRVLKARELFLDGYNCAQAVFCAFSDLYGVPEELALRMSASFGGGIGRMRNMCGAVCGMAMLAGLEKGQTKPHDDNAKNDNYHLVQELAGRFKEVHGSVICAELLNLRKGAPTPPTPDARTAEYYRTRPCLYNVESAARIYAEWLNSKER